MTECGGKQGPLLLFHIQWMGLSFFACNLRVKVLAYDHSWANPGQVMVNLAPPKGESQILIRPLCHATILAARGSPAVG